MKCNETQPGFTKCRNAGIECPGYARRLTFVDKSPHIDPPRQTAMHSLRNFNSNKKSPYAIPFKTISLA
jgi:hypothetical protein